MADAATRQALARPRWISATLASFLAYFAMSAMLAPIGLIAPSLAETIGSSVTDATASFSSLTVGILVGSALALVLVPLLPLRWLMAGIYLVAAVALATLALHTNPVGYWLALGAVGVAFGIGLAGAALTISRLYDGERRASMLVVTDACFSIAGKVISALAGVFVAMSLPWSATYLVVAGVCALIALLSAARGLPEGDAGEESPALRDVLALNRWPRVLWLCIGALFLYTLGQNAMLWWLPSYLAERDGVDVADAGVLVGQYWLGMFVAQLVVAVAVLRLGVPALVLAGSLGALIGSVSLWLGSGLDTLVWLTLLWGFANLGLLKTVLSLGTEAAGATGSVVSALLFGATCGTAVSPWLTSQIVAATDLLTVLQFSSACYAVMVVVLLLVRRAAAVRAH